MDEVLEELSVVVAHASVLREGCGMELDAGGEGVEDAGLEAAQHVAYGWPSRHTEPTMARHAGRLAKAFPLEFPMGIGDLHEDRPRPVSPEEHVQHLLRLRTGHIVKGERGHRVVWALVNAMLIGEAAGKAAKAAVAAPTSPV